MSTLIGTTRTSNSCGDFEILEKVGNNYEFLIRFLDTNAEQVSRGSAIVSGSVRDKSIPKKKNNAKYGVGTCHQTNNYGFIKILSVIDEATRSIVFLDTGYEGETVITQIGRGTVKDPTRPRVVTEETAMKRGRGTIKVKEGQVLKNNRKEEYTILEIKQANQIRIRFTTTGYERWTSSVSIRNGYVVDPMSPTVYGVGYLGTLEKTEIQSYNLWKGMIQRVHNNEYYADVEIDERWYNYSTFCQDLLSVQNYDKWRKAYGTKEWHFDKDILFSGNRKYGPNLVCFVHAEDNQTEVCIRQMRKKYDSDSSMYLHLSSALVALRDQYVKSK